MPRLFMVPTFFREVFISRQFEREPEPDLIMNDEDQVRSYAEAGRIDGVMSASYLFQSARISAVIADRENVVDLGCGPATQLAQVASLNPNSFFTGIDLSAEMLSNAKQHIDEEKLENVNFVQDDITELNQFKENSADAVISTMALHHLPSINDLKNCLKQIRRILKPSGGIYLTDFSRLKSLYSILFFAYLNKDRQPALFSLDYERSLRAAFLYSDYVTLASEIFGDQVKVVSTFGIPILKITKTSDRPLPAKTIVRLKQLRKKLPFCYRRELDDIRFFFWMSGLKNDPF